MIEPIGDIPRKDEIYDDIGNIRYRDLVPPTNLAMEFRQIRNLIAGSGIGNLSHEGIANDIIIILFCKIIDEQTHRDRNDEALMSFRHTAVDSPEDVRFRIDELFDRVNEQIHFQDVMEPALSLDDRTVASIVFTLQKYRLLNADRDVIGNAFEIFVGPALAGDEGQFFTPRVVVEAMVDMLGVSHKDLIVDPACGSGGFLTVCLERVVELIDRNQNWDLSTRELKKMRFAMQNLHGIDKNRFLSRVTKAYMALLGDGRSNIFCDDSLLAPSDWQIRTQANIALEKFDALLTNPPFGSNLKIAQKVFRNYTLARKWSNPTDGNYVRGARFSKISCPSDIVH